MNDQRVERQLRRVAQQLGSRSAVVEGGTTTTYAGIWSMAEAEARALGGGSHVVVIEPASAAATLARFFGALLAGRPALVLPPGVPAAALPHLDAPPAADDLLWGLTSGTMAAPKLFARSHASWLASFAAADAVAPLAPGDHVALPGPPGHSLFLFGAVHALVSGATVLALAPFHPRRVAEALSGDVARLYAVPAMLGELLRAGLRRHAGSPRDIWCGGAALSPELRAAVAERLPTTELIAFYGASELSFVAFESGGRRGLFPGVAVRIGADERITVASPMVFRGYLGQPPHDGWVASGDRGVLTADGGLSVLGRADRVIVTKGRKVAPEPIEAALAGLPGVLRAGVVGMADARRGQAVAAAVNFAGTVPPRRVLAAHCRTAVGAADVPHRFYAADALPLTASGKVALGRLAGEIGRPEHGYRLIA